MEKAKDDALRHLFASAQIDSNKGYDISSIAKNHQIAAVKLGESLKIDDLVKEDISLSASGDTVVCSISAKGIARIAPEWIADKIALVLSGMGEAGTLGNIADILKTGPEGFQLAFDLANEMQNRDLIKLLYAFFPGNKVMIEMTLEGVREKLRTKS